MPVREAKSEVAGWREVDCSCSAISMVESVAAYMLSAS